MNTATVGGSASSVWRDPDPRALFEIRAALIPAYVDYCRTVSRRSMAVSLETNRQARTVADFGSGWSSYVLRRYARTFGGVTVVSVDDDPAWLHRTEQFLVKRWCDTDNLVLWGEYAATGFDVVLHDFSSGELRESSMPVAAEALNEGGLIMFDDAQHEGHRAAMEAVCDAYELEMVDVRRWTEDAVNRYALVGAR